MNCLVQKKKEVHVEVMLLNGLCTEIGRMGRMRNGRKRRSVFKTHAQINLYDTYETYITLSSNKSNANQHIIL